jgi:iron(III) transport system substrate-binding protein
MIARNRRPASLALTLAAALLGFAIVACAPARQAEPAASPGAPAARPDPAAAWGEVLAAARREGRVVVRGPVGADARDGLVQGFQERYPEIQVDYSGARGTEQAPKLIAEHQAGQHLVDVLVNGTTTQIDLLDAGILDPIQPYLVGSEVQSAAGWLGDKFDFADDQGKAILVFHSAVKVPLAYNPRLISPTDIKSYKDLLDPKWRGKLAMLDPRSAGAGLATATFFYTTPSLGQDFLSQILAAGLVFSKDERQILDWVARGQYPVALAPSETVAVELVRRGLPIESLDAEALQEGNYFTSGFGAVGVLNKAPHPNATKVYVNWLLSREGQTEVSRAVGYPSRRLDVPTEHLNPSMIPKPGMRYQENYKEPYVRIREELVTFLRTAIRD